MKDNIRLKEILIGFCYAFLIVPMYLFFMFSDVLNSEFYFYFAFPLFFIVIAFIKFKFLSAKIKSSLLVVVYYIPFTVIALLCIGLFPFEPNDVFKAATLIMVLTRFNIICLLLGSAVSVAIKWILSKKRLPKRIFS